jgi:hypothetical protein
VKKKDIAGLQRFCLEEMSDLHVYICPNASSPYPVPNRQNERVGSHMRDYNPVLSYIKALNKLCFVSTIQSNIIAHGNTNTNVYLVPHVLHDAFAIYKFFSILSLKASRCASKQKILAIFIAQQFSEIR